MKSNELAKLMEGFFKSGYSTISEYKKVLLETEARTTWDDAVTVFRTGTKKLQSNDFSGLDDIRKANELLKLVISNYSNTEVTTKVQYLNESITSFDVNNLDEEIEMLEYQMGTLKNRLEDAGLDNLQEVNDTEEVPADELPDETTVTPEIKPTTETPPTSGTPDVTTSTETPVVANSDVTKSDQQKQDTNPNVIKNGAKLGAFVKEEDQKPFSDVSSEPAPEVNLSTGSSSGVNSCRSGDVKNAYEEGFQEGRKAWMEGKTSKEISKDLVEKELKEHKYAYVQNWQEGFENGFKHEQRVRIDRGESKSVEK